MVGIWSRVARRTIPRLFQLKKFAPTEKNITWPDGQKITADELPTVNRKKSCLPPNPSAFGQFFGKMTWVLILIVLNY